MISRASRLLLPGLIACLATGCGLQKEPHAGGLPGPAGGSGPAATHRAQPGGHGSPPVRSGSPQPMAAACTMPDITVRLDTSAAGVAAGTSYLPLDFTNSGTSSCLLTGFPDVTIAASQSGRQVGKAAIALAGAGQRVITLATGQTAHTWLRLAQVANLPPARCRPVQAAGLRISLPGQGQVTFVPHPLMACGRAAGGLDVLMVEPFRPGLATPGSAR